MHRPTATNDDRLRLSSRQPRTRRRGGSPVCSIRWPARYDLMNDLMSGGPAPALEAVCSRAQRRASRAAGAGRGRRHRRSRAPVRTACWRLRRGRAHRHQRAACSGAGATGWSMLASSSRRSSATPSGCRFADGYFDCVMHRLRAAQRDAQSACAPGDDACAAPRRPGAGAGVLAVWEPLQPLYDAYSFQVLPRWAAGDRRRAEAIATWPNRSACTRPGRAEDDDGSGGAGARRVLEPERRGGRAASRLSSLERQLL